MSGRLMDCWRCLAFVLLASVWTPACKESDDEAGYDAAGNALHHRASTHGGTPDDAEPSLCETVCADVAPPGAPESTHNLLWAELRETPVAFGSNQLVTVCSQALDSGDSAGTLRHLTLQVGDKFVVVIYSVLDRATSGKAHRARAQPVVEHHSGPRAVDFGLAYDVVPVGWTGVSATD
jgi:hypothetical protein